MNEKKTVNTKDLKKKRLIALVLLIGAILLLVLLNTLDFENNSAAEDSTTAYTPDTQPEQNFYEPDYETDVMTLPAYQKLDLTINYTFDGQTVSLENDYRPDYPYTEFFVQYFDALRQGFGGSTVTTEGFNALHSAVFFRTNETFGKFAPQKVYDIEIERISDVQTITNADKTEDIPYVGCTLAVFEVRYKIYLNDGTFRRDISEEDVIPQLFTLLYDRAGKVTINAISYFRHSEDPSPQDDASLFSLVLPLVFLVILLVTAVLALILKKKPLAAPAIASLVSFITSMLNGSVVLQIILFVVLTVLLIGGDWVYRKKHKKTQA